MRDWSRAKNSSIADQCDRLTQSRYADVAKMAESAKQTRKTETVDEYLARGGRITKLRPRH